MAKRESSFIVANLTSEIGIDASYYRKEHDRLYFSGIEIATILGTGVLSSVLIGFLNGIKKSIEEHAEQLGKDLMDSLIERLKRIREKVRAIDASDPEVAMKQVKGQQRELDDIINLPTVESLAMDESEDLKKAQVLEVLSYLRDVGYPPDMLEERAEHLVVRVQREWRAG